MQINYEILQDIIGDFDLPSPQENELQKVIDVMRKDANEAKFTCIRNKRGLHVVCENCLCDCWVNKLINKENLT